MDDNYLYRMQKYENDYLDYIRAAGDVRAANGGSPTKEECILLQKAASCQSEMANMSIGEEKMYHQRKIRELGAQIQNIVRVLNPKALEGKGNDGRSGAGSADGAPSAGSGRAAAEDDIDTTGWISEAPKHSFEDVAGMDEVKETLRACINDTKTAKLRAYLKQSNLHSFFFYGPPGCGKTYLIEAFIHELMEKDYKYLTLDGSRILSKYVGEAEKIVTKLFTMAQENAPCIVFIDEIDGVCKNRSLPNLPEYASSITTSFLTGYNRLQTTQKPIIFIGATNYPEQVDNAMLDRVELVRIPLPDQPSRKYLFMHQLKNVISLGDDLSWEDIALRTESYNARDVKRLTGHLMHLIEKKLMEKYQDEDKAIEALSTGSFKLDKGLFDEAYADYRPAPKESILQALDAWEAKYQKKYGDEGGEPVDTPDGPILRGINAALGVVNDPMGIGGLISNIASLTGSIATLVDVLQTVGIIKDKDREDEEKKEAAPEPEGNSSNETSTQSFIRSDGSIDENISGADLLSILDMDI